MRTEKNYSILKNEEEITKNTNMVIFDVTFGIAPFCQSQQLIYVWSENVNKLVEKCDKLISTSLVSFLGNDRYNPNKTAIDYISDIESDPSTVLHFPKIFKEFKEAISATPKTLEELQALLDKLNSFHEYCDYQYEYRLLDYDAIVDHVKDNLCLDEIDPNASLKDLVNEIEDEYVCFNL